MIEIERLTVHYGARRALQEVTLRLLPGQLTLLTGPSGCGKSTLARAICGLIPQALPARVEGRVTVDGLDAAAHPLAELATHVGLVLQNPAAQLFCATVEEEVSSGPRNRGLDEAAVAARTGEALQALGIPHLRDRLVRHLSSGEQQRVAIAATLALRPTALVLDEPASRLDLAGVGLLLETLRRLTDEHGMAVLVIEHRAELLAPVADRVLFMEGGALVADGPAGELLARRDLLTRLGVRYPWQTLQEYWEDVLPDGRPGPPVGPDPLVAMAGVRADYGGGAVLQGVDLAIGPGELVALVGENGAGKSTVGRVLAGLLRPRQGRVRWQRDLPSPRVGLVLQDALAQLFNDTVEEEIAFGPRNLRRYDPAQVEELLAQADLRERRASGILNLSAGQQQRLAVAAVAALQPALLVVDEPTVGQDWQHLSQMLNFLRRLNARGTSILLITHDAKLICRYVPRVVVLQAGRVVADGAPRRTGAARAAGRDPGPQEEVSHVVAHSG